MAVFSTIAKSSSQAFSTIAKTLRTFGDLTDDEIGALTFDSNVNGKAIGSYAFTDSVGTIYTTVKKN